MGHEIAKLLLEHAGTFLERAKAIETALSMGMPLHKIEEYLDWLDVTRGPLRDDVEQREEGPQGPQTEPPSEK
jgi:DNA-binding transcriptional MerR regulator